MVPYIVLIVCGIIFVIVTARDNRSLTPVGPIMIVFGAIGLITFLITGGSGLAAILGAILTVPVLFASHWLLTKLFQKLDAETDALRAKTMNKTGTISHPIDVMDMGRVTLDSPIDEESEFEVWSRTHMAVGTRVVVYGIMEKQLLVKVLPSTMSN